ncbi:MAG: hypothetical protein CMC18_06390 [Flavobacteriaceae bacterium]|nr:hypothetical protein [Flavobacteriaceae bacterium]
MSEEDKPVKKKTTRFLESKFYVYLSILGMVVSSYIVFDYITQEQWLDAFLFLFVGLTAFGFPLINRFKKHK